MSTQKQRIADFIESVETEEVGLSTVLLGGATKDPDSPMTAKNNGACKNVSAKGCNKSSNGGNCVNQLECCNDSTNNGDCDNGWLPISNYCTVAPLNPCA